MSRKNSILAGLFLLTALIAGFGFWAKKPSSPRGAPEFSLETQQGERFRLKDYRDQVLVIHFWASWCAPCLPELPLVIEAARRLERDPEGRPIRWLLISVDESWDQAKKVLSAHSLPTHLGSALDPEGKVADRYGTFQYPETYVLDRSHRVVAKWIGAQDWSGDWGRQALDGITQISLQRTATFSHQGK